MLSFVEFVSYGSDMGNGFLALVSVVGVVLTVLTCIAFFWRLRDA
jgi:hypothetical protein